MARSRSNEESAPEVVSGWTLLFHPLLLDQLERLTAAAEADLKKARRGGTAPTANVKVLAALRRSMFETMPADPTRAEFRQGDTLGPERRHWFRDKFGAGRFRLFFRFSSRLRIIVYAWVNDAESLRTYGARTDAYAEFRQMLDRENPPDSWDALVRAASDRVVLARAKRVTHGR